MKNYVILKFLVNGMLKYQLFLLKIKLYKGNHPLHFNFFLFKMEVKGGFFETIL